MHSRAELAPPELPADPKLAVREAALPKLAVLARLAVLPAEEKALDTGRLLMAALDPWLLATGAQA